MPRLEESTLKNGHLCEEEVLFRVAVALAVGSLWMVLRHRREGQDEMMLEQKVEAQLRALREHLLRRQPASIA